jgi:S-DNA-T family DNA segregation ATPase FtsK/SpoIIIE
MRRYGLQPMAVINPHDPMPDLAAVMLCRCLWRYRSELAPVGVGLGTLIAASILHASHPRYWPFMVIVTVGLGAGLIVAGRRVGLATRAERLYAATVVAAVGGWLAAGTGIGPTRNPLPPILLLVGPVLAVPWWAHRRRRAKVRVERTLEVWPEIAQAVGLAGSRVQSVLIDVWGWRARFGLARGQTIADVIAKVPAIESGLGTYRGAVRVYPTSDNMANRFELRVLDSDPHADAIAWPGPSVTTITESIDLGPFEDASPARVLFLRRHVLVGGVSGSGKSGGLNVIMGNLSACSDVVIWAIDLKRGMELGPWAACLGRLATTPGEARALLADAVAVLEGRAELLAATGQRVWNPSPELPALVVVVDEYAELAEEAPDATGYADSIARRGRAVAVTLIAATQRPTQKAMGQGALRSQMDVRICFRVRERRDVDLVLGQGMLAAGWQAHTLNAPGKFLISAPEHDTPRRARAFLVTDEAVDATVQYYAGSRPELDETSSYATEARAEMPETGVADPTEPAFRGEEERAPETLLWAALTLAPEEGISVPDLMTATGMSRRWVYYRLREHAQSDRAEQTERGTWRAKPAPDGDMQ